jgi:hypothetical protein
VEETYMTLAELLKSLMQLRDSERARAKRIRKSGHDIITVRAEFLAQHHAAQADAIDELIIQAETNTSYP